MRFSQEVGVKQTRDNDRILGSNRRFERSSVKNYRSDRRPRCRPSEFFEGFYKIDHLAILYRFSAPRTHTGNKLRMGDAALFIHGSELAERLRMFG